MKMKSKFKKYVHKCQILSRVDDFAYLERSIFRFEHMRHLRMSRETRWSSQNLQKMPNFVSRVHNESCPQNQKSKKRGHLSSFQPSKARRARSTSVYQARSLSVRLRARDRATYAPASPPGRPHAHAHTLSFKALELFG